MPLPTPNRGYPYSVPGDPADVPAAIQALAEAIDLDITSLEGLVGPRQMARASGSTTVVNQQNIIPSDLPLEVIDFNVGGAIGPISNGAVTLQQEGLWFMFATLVYSAWPGTANIDYVSFEIVEPGSGTDYATTSVHAAPALNEISRQMDVGAAVFASPGQVVGLRSEVGRTAGTAQYPLRARSLTVIRMTDAV